MAKKILLIDDEKMVTDSFSRTLKVLGGFDVTVINKVNDIYSHLEQSPKYDLILLDLMMENTDGFEIIERLNQDNGKYNIENVPIVLLTNVSSEEARNRAKKYKNVVDYLVKTENPGDKLVSKINEILASNLTNLPN